jgi:hypothetical protein
VYRFDLHKEADVCQRAFTQVEAVTPAELAHGTLATHAGQRDEPPEAIDPVGAVTSAYQTKQKRRSASS